MHLASSTLIAALATAAVAAVVVVVVVVGVVVAVAASVAVVAVQFVKCEMHKSLTILIMKQNLMTYTSSFSMTNRDSAINTGCQRLKNGPC